MSEYYHSLGHSLLFLLAAFIYLELLFLSSLALIVPFLGWIELFLVYVLPVLLVALVGYSLYRVFLSRCANYAENKKGTTKRRILRDLAIVNHHIA